MASSKSKSVEGVEVFSPEPEKASKAATKRKTSQKPKAVSRADKINKLYEKAEGIAGKAVEELTPIFIEIGNELIAQKEELKHGEWIPWIKENLPFGESEARNYMRAARNRQRVADLPSLRRAIALLSDGTEEAVVEDPEPSKKLYTEDELNKKIKEVTKIADDTHDEMEREMNAEIERLTEQVGKLKSQSNLTEEEEAKLKDLKKQQAALRKEISETESIKKVLDIIKKDLKELSPLMATNLSPTVVKNNKSTAKAVVEGLEGVIAFFKEKFNV